MRLFRILVITAGLLALWQGIVAVFETPPFILPGPDRVLSVWWSQLPLIGSHAVTTITEILLGLLIGSVLGMVSALTMVRFQPAQAWLMPVKSP